MQTEDDSEVLKQLSDIYEELRGDAKQIVVDLEGGVAMWREASAGAFASAMFLVILALTFAHGSAGNPLDFWGSIGLTIFVALAAILAVAMTAFGAFGFRRYYLLKRRYAGLFAKVAKLG